MASGGPARRAFGDNLLTAGDSIDRRRQFLPVTAGDSFCR